MFRGIHGESPLRIGIDLFSVYYSVFTVHCSLFSVHSVRLYSYPLLATIENG
jgi:hypothetical protein